MNIFVLDQDPQLAAQYHCDSHVVKMILESAQLLSTAHHVFGSWSFHMYKPTHINHPCSLWVRQSTSNYTWLWELLRSLCYEFHFRRGKVHSTAMLLGLLQTPPGQQPKLGLTDFALAMPDQYKSESAVSSYRRFYACEKKHLLAYSKRARPEWLEQLVCLGQTGKM